MKKSNSEKGTTEKRQFSKGNIRKKTILNRKHFETEQF